MHASSHLKVYIATMRHAKNYLSHLRDFLLQLCAAEL